MSRDQIINLLAGRLHDLITINGNQEVIRELSHLLRQATNERRNEIQEYNGPMVTDSSSTFTLGGVGNSLRSND